MVKYCSFPQNMGKIQISIKVGFCPGTCRTPLHAAAFAEDVAGLQLVLRHGAEINAVDQSGRSALMVASDKGQSGTVGKSRNLPYGTLWWQSW